MRGWRNKTFILLTDLCWFATSVLVIGSALWWLTQRPVFALKGIDVAVEGNSSAITAKGLAELLKDKAGGTFFTADIAGIRDLLIQIPWVKSVSVSREWPNKIAVKLVLHKPIARWGDGELLTEEGNIFQTNTAIAEGEEALPLLSGPVKSALMIFSRYRSLNAVCEKYGSHAVGLSLEEFGGWKLSVRRPNGSPLEIMFSPNETTVGMEGTLNKILRELGQIRTYFGRDPQKIDARYDSGIVVRQPEDEEVDGQEPDSDGEDKNGR